jgi:propanediol utilization protein
MCCELLEPSMCARENRETEAEGQLAGIGLRVGKIAVVTGELRFQPRVVRRRLHLHATGQRVLDFLEENDVGVVPTDFRDRRLELEGCVIRIGVIPDLAKLHVELKDAEGAHRRRRGGGAIIFSAPRANRRPE